MSALIYTHAEWEEVNTLSTKPHISPVEAARAARALMEDACRDCPTGYPDDNYRTAILNIELFLDDHA